MNLPAPLWWIVWYRGIPIAVVEAYTASGASTIAVIKTDLQQEFVIPELVDC